MTVVPPETRAAFKAIDRMAAAVVLQSESADRMAAALEKMERHLSTLSGVVEMVDNLDTSLGHHIGEVSDAVEKMSAENAKTLAGLAGGIQAGLRMIAEAVGKDET